MPPLEAYGHLVDFLYEVGPGLAGEALTYQELEAWSRLTGYQLSSWEAQTLRALSAAFLAEFHAASDPMRRPPYLPEG